MASITANGSKGHHKFTLTVTETSTSEANNTSTISYSFKIAPIKIPSSEANAWYWENYTRPECTVSYKFVINGTTYSDTIPEYHAMSEVTLKSGTQTVTHNTDGTKTISFSFVVTDTTTVNYTSGNASANGTLALTAFEIEKPVTGSAPIITASVVDTNSKTIAYTGNSSKLIKYHSNAKATMTVTPQNGATINESLLIIRNGSRSGYGYNYTFDKVESDTFYFYATDDRNYEGMKAVEVDMVNYVKLTCNMGNSRPDASGNMTLTCSGNYFNGSFGAQYNSLTVTYRYIGSGVDTTKYSSYGYGNMSIAKSDNTYTACVDLSNLDYQATYSFEIIAEDELESATAVNSAVKSKPIFHWGENNFTFEVPVIFNGTNKPMDWGEWTPELNEPDAVMGYVGKHRGWYQKVGNVVTIGWMLKAYIYKDKNGINLSIIPKDLPYSPAHSAFGGGVAHNIYISGGYAFEGWNIDTDQEITARLQPCNNTSAGNLDISPNCYYPYCSSNAEKLLTLAGTICYITND